MGPPGVDGLLHRVVPREVVTRDLNGQPLVKIPLVLIPKGVPVIFRVAGDEDAPAVLVAHKVDARLRGGGQNVQLGADGHIPFADFRVAGVGRQEPVVKAAHQRILRNQVVVLENTEHLAV